jgi:hypothetical protein
MCKREAQGTEETGSDRPAAPSSDWILTAGAECGRVIEEWPQPESALVAEMVHAANWITRKQWRECSLEFVLLPVLTGPRLVFGWFNDPTPIFTDVDGSQCDALAKLTEMRQAWPKVKATPERIPLFQRAVRRLWCQIVDQATGYAWPDAPSVLFTFE